MTRILDLSHPIATGMPVYPGDPAVEVLPAATVARDGFAVSSVRLGSHSGTHVDAPAHRIPNGATIDEVDLAALVGPARVVRARGLAPGDAITLELVGDQLEDDCGASGERIVLFDTGWDAHFGTPLTEHHPVLSPALAAQLVASGVRAVGVDTLSPDATLQAAEAVELPVHDALLGAGVLIVENLRGLGAIPGARCGFSALPLRLAGADAAPVRAVAFIEG